MSTLGSDPNLRLLRAANDDGVQRFVRNEPRASPVERRVRHHLVNAPEPSSFSGVGFVPLARTSAGEHLLLREVRSRIDHRQRLPGAASPDGSTRRGVFLAARGPCGTGISLTRRSSRYEPWDGCPRRRHRSSARRSKARQLRSNVGQPPTTTPGESPRPVLRGSVGLSDRGKS